MALIQELQATVTRENRPILPHLDHINACLHNAVLSCRAAMNLADEEEPRPKFSEKENIPPGKNLEHQWRFVRTSKQSGRKRTGNAFRYVGSMTYSTSNNVNVY